MYNIKHHKAELNEKLCMVNILYSFYHIIHYSYKYFLLVLFMLVYISKDNKYNSVAHKFTYTDIFYGKIYLLYCYLDKNITVAGLIILLSCAIRN